MSNNIRQFSARCTKKVYRAFLVALILTPLASCDLLSMVFNNYDGFWIGTTSQSNEIRIQVSNNRIFRIKYAINTNQYWGSQRIDAIREYGDAPDIGNQISSSKFKIVYFERPSSTYVGEIGDLWDIEGVFSDGKHVSGSITTYEQTDFEIFDPKIITWNCEKSESASF